MHNCYISACTQQTQPTLKCSWRNMTVNCLPFSEMMDVGLWQMERVFIYST